MFELIFESIVIQRISSFEKNYTKLTLWGKIAKESLSYQCLELFCNRVARYLS
ncbi:hypothetical protein VCRA2123O443_40208 [Vibrio crassostreae]|nr:hypothetical protein VCRA2110O182_40135 [Vibrio crassostreae]CAK2344707.1 hypothetical protein VCRA2111O408_40135 [Vibrio crassostreae]CAK2355082.1 hypothetical protein VCRA211O406_30206 [Vibrio crassostreae]CAK3409754.1 hypothetical protein VCRA2123O443_40208 [Vibrio crassostreae]